MPNDDLKKLLERNLALTEDIHFLVKKINKYIIMSQVAGVIKIVLILAPLIAAIILLPPYLQSLLKNYSDILPQGVELKKDSLNNFNQFLKN